MFGVALCNFIAEAVDAEIENSKASWKNSSDISKHINCMLERMNEPISFRKGMNRTVKFNIPREYVNARYQKIGPIDSSGPTSDVEVLDIKRINLPDIRIPSLLGRQDIFSIFLPVHREYAVHLIKLLMGMNNTEDFISASVFCREHVNPHLLVYALSVAMVHRKDTENLPLPSVAEIFPEKFMDRGVFPKARQEANVVPPGFRTPIEIPMDYTASNLEPEHRVAYFREDVGINLAHWYWHIFFPSDGPSEILKNDRAGELFYYFHQQIVGRYDFERLCNNLGRVERLLDWRKPIKEGYFPKLDNTLASRVWPSRQKYAKLKNIEREMDQVKVDIQHLERYRDRIYEAIHQGAVINKSGKLVPLTEETGIDILGHMIQSTAVSVNRKYYGEMHNNGHILIGYIHDPDGRHLENIGVMGDSAVAMRDPLFYRWHKFIDSIFQEYKNTLRKYTVQELDFPGVTVTSVEVVTQNAPVNEFVTFWQKSDIELYKGLDFTPIGSVMARVTHLQHEPFSYKIVINNSGPLRKGTVRIFMAPKYDERGLPMLFRDQRHHFIQLDHFAVKMYPGNNKYERQSSESSVTFPVEQTFTNLNGSNPQKQGSFTHCGCGWPENMLIPKGTPEGYPVELFVIVSDFSLDNVEQKPPDGCRRPFNYCGWRKRKYPDKRAMGYPFDRNPRSGVSTLKEFITPNMKVETMKIKFIDKIIVKKNIT